MSNITITQQQSEVETWKAIAGFVGMYEVSSHGRIRSVDRLVVDKRGVETSRKGKILTLDFSTKGYAKFCLPNKKRMFVHHAVAEAFIGPKPSRAHEINHISGDKSDNSYLNLEWCSRSKNITHSVVRGLRKTKLTPLSVRVIRRLLERGHHHGFIAEAFGVSRYMVSEIKTGRCWSCVPATRVTTDPAAAAVQKCFEAISGKGGE